jgi:hypothetical protein
VIPPGQRSTLRHAGVWLSLAALVLTVLPSSASYRCAMTDRVMSAPCCAHGPRQPDDGRTTFEAACCERLPSTAVTVTAVREPAPAHSAPHLAFVWTLLPIVGVHDSNIVRTGALRLRAGPPDPHLRVPTVVLRV